MDTDYSDYCLFMSDLHIGNPLLKRRHELVSILSRPYLHVFLVGDIFDVWTGNLKDIINENGDIVYILKNLKNLTYIIGNHDPRLVDVWNVIPNADVVKEKVLALGSKKFHLSHGEELDYLWYRYSYIARILFLFNLLWEKVFKFSLKDKIGSVSKYKDKKYYSKLTKEIADISNKIYDSKVDFIIRGHMHTPMVVGKYYNCGDWVSNYTYLEYDINKSNLQVINHY